MAIHAARGVASANARQSLLEVPSRSRSSMSSSSTGVGVGSQSPSLTIHSRTWRRLRTRSSVDYKKRLLIDGDHDVDSSPFTNRDPDRRISGLCASMFEEDANSEPRAEHLLNLQLSDADGGAVERHPSFGSGDGDMAKKRAKQHLLGSYTNGHAGTVSFKIDDRMERGISANGVSPLTPVRTYENLRQSLEEAPVVDIDKLFCGFKILDPTISTFLFSWDLFVGFLLCVVAVEAPYETVFIQPEMGALFIANRCVDIVFITDMLLQFVTAQEDPLQPGNYVRRPSTIARIYFKGWFLIDVVSVLPVDIIVVASEASSSFGMPRGLRNVKVVRLMRLARLLRLARVQRLLVRWQSSTNVSFAIQSLIQFVVVLLIVSHWLACLWASIAWKSDEEDNWISAMLSDKKGDMQGSNMEETITAWQVYWISLYWAVMTLTSIGYGDIVATNHTEYMVATMCMLFMAGIWAYTIGAVCGIVATLQPHEVAFKQTMDDLNNLMHDCGMPHEVQMRLRKYFYASRAVNRRKVERHIIDSMSPMLQGEILLFGNKRYLNAVPYLAGMSYKEKICAAQYLEAGVYAPTEYIMAEKTLFIVQTGLCLRQMCVLLPEMTWGQGNLILSNPNLWDPEGAYALTHVQVLSLRADDMKRIVERFQGAKRLIHWARMKYGIMRACMLIQETEVHLEDSRWANQLEELEPHHKMMMWTDIMKGRFKASMLDEYLQLDEDDIEDHDLSLARNNRKDSLVMAAGGVVSATSTGSHRSGEANGEYQTEGIRRHVSTTSGLHRKFSFGNELQRKGSVEGGMMGSMAVGHHGLGMRDVRGVWRGKPATVEQAMLQKLLEKMDSLGESVERLTQENEDLRDLIRGRRAG